MKKNDIVVLKATGEIGVLDTGSSRIEKGYWFFITNVAKKVHETEIESLALYQTRIKLNESRKELKNACKENKHVDLIEHLTEKVQKYYIAYTKLLEE